MKNKFLNSKLIIFAIIYFVIIMPVIILNLNRSNKIAINAMFEIDSTWRNTYDKLYELSKEAVVDEAFISFNSGINAGLSLGLSIMNKKNFDKYNERLRLLDAHMDSVCNRRGWRSDSLKNKIYKRYGEKNPNEL